MAVEETLARIEEDLRCGNAALAKQRLRGLRGSYPQRLDIRDLLAEVYRRKGNLVQAGRWSYLSDNAVPEEIAAFERAYPEHTRLMAALGWRGTESEASTEFARERLIAVRERAENSANRPLTWDKPQEGRPEEMTVGECAAGVLGCLMAVFLLSMVILGLVTLIRGVAG